MARQQWTQFGDLSMVLGLALFAATLVLQAAAAFGGSDGSSEGAPANTSKPRTRRAAATEADPPAGAGWLAGLGQQLRDWQLVASWQPGHWLQVPTFRAWLAGVALLHGLGIFSFFYLLSEGKWARGQYM